MNDFVKLYWNSMRDVPEPLRTSLLKAGFWEQNGLILYARTHEVSCVYTVDLLRERAAMMLALAQWMEKKENGKENQDNGSFEEEQE